MNKGEAFGFGGDTHEDAIGVSGTESRLSQESRSNKVGLLARLAAKVTRIFPPIDEAVFREVADIESQLDQDSLAYLRTHGTLPPFVSLDTKPVILRERIEVLRDIANRTHNDEEAMRLSAEISYLQSRLPSEQPQNLNDN